jgi:D-lactate dehydrogenase (quinone)
MQKNLSPQRKGKEREGTGGAVLGLLDGATRDAATGTRGQISRKQSGLYSFPHPLDTERCLSAGFRRARIGCPGLLRIPRTIGCVDLRRATKSVSGGLLPLESMDEKSALTELRHELKGSLVDQPDAVSRYRGDASHLRATPLAAALPEDVGDVQRIVRWARRHRIPLVPRGAGTSLDGESVPVVGGVVVDLSGWNTIQQLKIEERTVRVAPGVINRELQRWLQPHGLFYPPNPGSWNESTLGGNVATNASGPRSFRYGPTRHWVRALAAVLGTGEQIAVGNRAAKRSTGPDLLHLLIGSEGTLAILTELTLEVAPLPARRMGLVVSLATQSSPGEIAGHLATGKIPGISALEYLDAGSARQLAAEPGSRLSSEHALLLLEIESPDEREEERQLELLAAELRALGIREDPDVYPDADELWTLRGQSGVALDRRWGSRIREDVAVPLGSVDALLQGIETIAARSGVAVFVYGHLGEGSLHPNFIVDPATTTAETIRSELLHLAHALEGTISGEHGIGSLKARYLPLEVGTAGVSVLEGIKRVFDPEGILNPGKGLTVR